MHAGRRRRGKKKRNNLFVTRSLSLNGGHQRKRARSDAPRQATFNQGEDSSQAPSAGSEHSFCLLMHEQLPPLHPPLYLFSAANCTEAEVEAAPLFPSRLLSLLEAEMHVEVPSFLGRRATTRLENQ